MFQMNKDYIGEDVESIEYIKKSGCYEVVIEKAEQLNGYNSKSEGIALNFSDSESRRGNLRMYYTNRDGLPVEFNQRHLSHLCYLLNQNALLPGQDKQIASLIGKIIGVVIEVNVRDYQVDNNGTKERRYAYDYILKSFYDSQTKQTSKEKLENRPAEIYNSCLQRYENAVEIELPKSEKLEDAEGFYQINNADIPF